VKIILCILDGWGYSDTLDHNAIKLSRTPCYDKLLSNHPYSLLEASGASVGLPEGQVGNSEVGHIAIGSGRRVKQDLPRIHDAMRTESILQNQYIKEIIEKFSGSQNTCHIIGMASDGGVHGHIEHVIRLAKLLEKNNVKVILHLISDGRDALPKSAEKYMKMVLDSKLNIGSISGRFYAMDRDHRWDRTQKAYNAIVNGDGAQFQDVAEFIKSQYSQGLTDEFFVPVVSPDYRGISDSDAIICTNFRADRMRQLCTVIMDKNSAHFNTRDLKCEFYAFRPYSSKIAERFKIIFSNEKIENTLGDIISSNNLSQLRIAETEKYAHVTYFFNGGNEEELPLEARILISSPKVATYDLEPQMSAYKITDALEDYLGNFQPSFVCLNFANADMVGHSGSMDATIEAVETIDACLERILVLAKKQGYEILITADHGNAECMHDEESNQPLTAHTLNPVPFIYIGSKNLSLRDGELRDIAPTILELFGIDKPSEMTGTSLINGQ
jgi:2,3-bisphosphoglycerate-independent phosphoglycerate mutase